MRREHLILRLALLIIALVWLSGFLAFLMHVPSEEANDNQHTDAIVVLTGGGLRLERGLELLAQGRAPTLFISGVEDNVTLQSLAHSNKDLRPYIEKVSPGAVVLGHKARSTTGNAEETADWLSTQPQIHSIRLVTGNYHIARSVYELQQAMPGILIIPEPVFPNKGVRLIFLMFSEYNKFILSKLRHQF